MTAQATQNVIYPHDALNRPLKAGDTVAVIRSSGTDFIPMEVLGFQNTWLELIRCDREVDPAEPGVVSDITGFGFWGEVVKRSWFKVILVRTGDGREIPQGHPSEFM